MAPSKKKTTTKADAKPNLKNPLLWQMLFFSVKINAYPAEEEVFASPQVSLDYSWMRILD
jgi:hypothetical protein